MTHVMNYIMHYSIQSFKFERVFKRDSQCMPSKGSILSSACGGIGGGDR